ncbi:uncharacterized protein LOC141930950 isoform X2 [Strix aluco]|uniref:uncharacterized protein LOC141930950 isoform X2 n=1 Tax=Strix aluco TaxID=111821 RepID=UPI003DA623D9
MRKKYLTCQILPAVPRARAAFQGVVGPDDLQEFPSHLKPFCSSGVTTVTSRALSYHRREKVAPGFKAIPSACCFTLAAALLKKRRRDCSRQHHGMLIMTSTGLAVLSFSLLLAMDLQWPLIRGKRLYNSKWSYKAGKQEIRGVGDMRKTRMERPPSCKVRRRRVHLSKRHRYRKAEDIKKTDPREVSACRWWSKDSPAAQRCFACCRLLSKQLKF